MSSKRLLARSPALFAYLRARFPYLRNAEIDVRLAWADEAEIVGIIDLGDERLFVAGHEIEAAKGNHDDFGYLSPDERARITNYRDFRFHRPWPQPTLGVVFLDSLTTYGEHVAENWQATPSGPVTVMMPQVGSAQVWYGGNVAVIWEVLLSPLGKEGEQERAEHLVMAWRTIESILAAESVTRFYTEWRDPAYDDEFYGSVLKRMGYVNAGRVAKREIAVRE